MRHAAGLLAAAAIAGGAVAIYRARAEVGYVEIKTVPVAPFTQAALYLDSTRLDPIRQGSALLRQPVGRLTLESDGFGGTRATLCNIEVKKDRITSVTVSVLERPPRCLCRFTSSGEASDRRCIS
jgi:hypothetical protein